MGLPAPRGVVVLAVLAIAACSAAGDAEPGTNNPGGSGTPTQGASVQRAGGSVIMVSAPVDGVMEALLSGIIVRTASGCLALDDGTGEVPVLWPHGSVLLPGGLAVDVPDFGSVAVGDEVWSSGGYIGPDSTIAPEVPEECGPATGSTMAALQALLPQKPSDVPAR